MLSYSKIADIRHFLPHFYSLKDLQRKQRPRAVILHHSVYTGEIDEIKVDAVLVFTNRSAVYSRALHVCVYIRAYVHTSALLYRKSAVNHCRVRDTRSHSVVGGLKLTR